jgi:hypothetical protein
MSSFFEKLTQIERRIQSLVERGSISSLARSGDFGAQMVAAMEKSIIVDDSGRSTAADLYILYMDQDTAYLLQKDPDLVDQFGQMIYEAGKDSELGFSIPPRVKISADPSLEPGNFTVSTQYSMQQVDETGTLTVENNDRIEIPEYAFLIINGVHIYPLDESVVNLGRRSDNHVVVDDMRVSRVHAQIRAIRGHYVIFDLDSSGGTYVNGVLTSRVTLYPGDVISLAGVNLVYGEDAAYLSGDDMSSTQPLMPLPDGDKQIKR